MTQFEMTTSTEASSTGRASMVPSRNSTFERPVVAKNLTAFLRARASISGVMSTPIARPPSPTFWAARNTSLPAPLPRSSTTSPGARCEKATGFPHESPNSDSGTGWSGTV